MLAFSPDAPMWLQQGWGVQSGPVAATDLCPQPHTIPHIGPKEITSCMHGMLSRFSHVRLFATPWTVAHQVPLSMGFFRQEYWSGLPFPPPGDLSDPGIEPASLASQALRGGIFLFVFYH